MFDTWSVHDGQLFARHVLSEAARVPEELKCLMSRPARRVDSSVSALRFVLDCSAEKKKDSFTVHDGKSFSKHLFAGEGHTDGERRLLSLASASIGRPHHGGMGSHSSGLAALSEYASDDDSQPNSFRRKAASLSSSIDALSVSDSAHSAAEALRSWWLLSGVKAAVKRSSQPQRQRRRPIKTLPRCVALSIPIGATPRVGGGQAAAGGSRSASLLPVALKAWFELGGDVNATDEHGRSLLHYASVAANAEVVTELIERGAAVDARNNAQTTALCMVAHAGHDAIAALLLAAGADPNAVDRCDVTPLMMACRSGHVSMARMLLEGGADTAALDKRGFGCFTYAAGPKGKAVSIALRQHQKQARKQGRTITPPVAPDGGVAGHTHGGAYPSLELS